MKLGFVDPHFDPTFLALIPTIIIGKFEQATEEKVVDGKTMQYRIPCTHINFTWLGLRLDFRFEKKEGVWVEHKVLHRSSAHV